MQEFDPGRVNPMEKKGKKKEDKKLSRNEMMEVSFKEDSGGGIELGDIYGGSGGEVAMSANPLVQATLGGEWDKKWDKGEQCNCYVHRSSGESQWEVPDGYHHE